VTAVRAGHGTDSKALWPETQNRRRSMSLHHRVAFTAALLLPVLATPAAAQRWRADLGVNGGYTWFSNALGSKQSGLTDNGDVKFQTGPTVGSQLTLWLTPRIGFRVNAAYADRDLVDSNGSGRTTYVNDVNLWSGSGDLLFRLRAPNEEWNGSEFLPYLALGVGAKWHNPAGDTFTCNDAVGGNTFSCASFTVGTGEAANTFALGERSVVMGLAGLGTDIRLSPRLALRLEVNDRSYKPGVYGADMSDAENNIINLPDGGARAGKWVHEVGAQLGLHLLMGLARPELVAVAPIPLPPPPPTPPAARPTPPLEEPVSVCIIDPTAYNGLRLQDAMFLPATGDTIVELNGTRTPLRQSIGQVMVAGNADWYIRGEPLTLEVGDRQLQYLTYQGATEIPADQLAFLGTIKGYPVYAGSSDVVEFRGDLEQLRAAEGRNDLEGLLAPNQDLLGQLENVKLLYVPLDATGCVFQTVQQLEQVRKK